jgi:hypothetical protein
MEMETRERGEENCGRACHVLVESSRLPPNSTLPAIVDLAGRQFDFGAPKVRLPAACCHRSRIEPPLAAAAAATLTLGIGIGTTLSLSFSTTYIVGERE